MTKLCKFCGEDVNGTRHTNLRNEIESNEPPTTDWSYTLFDFLLAFAFALFMAWVLVEYIITPEALLAWVEAL